MDHQLNLKPRKDELEPLWPEPLINLGTAKWDNQTLWPRDVIQYVH